VHTLSYLHLKYTLKSLHKYQREKLAKIVLFFYTGGEKKGRWGEM